MTIATKSLTSSLVLILGLTAVSSQAFAGISAKTFMESVPFTQQELKTTQGVASVHKRVIVAAKKICVGDSITSRNLLSSKVVENCVADIAQKALKPAQFEILASYHNSLEAPAKIRASRFAKTDWTVEKFKMAQMDEPMIDVMP